MDERSLLYDYDPLLGWFPEKNSRYRFRGTVRILVQHSSQGFRDRDHGPKTSPRVLFLGDSFVWGYDVEEEACFTNVLQNKIGGKIEILNCGVSGYGTAQEFLLLKQQYDRYKPDVVFLMFAYNDRADNASGFGYGAYYRPYFVKDGTGGLLLKGVPVPLSLAYRRKNNFVVRHSALVRLLLSLSFKRHPAPAKDEGRAGDITEDIVIQMEQYLAKKGSELAVGFVSKDEGLMKLCKKEGIPFLDFTAITAQYHFPTHGSHWTREGHRRVAQSVYDFLRSRPKLSFK